MAYIFRQKLNLSDLAGLSVLSKRILIYEPEDYLAALYAHYLRQHNFDIKHCPDLRQVSEMIVSFQPHLLIFCADGREAAFKAPGLILALSRRFPDLGMITTARDLNHQGIKDLMDAGVLGHLNRRLSRPQDIPILVKTILHQY
jgi:DNA-binding NtrC family response regulator